MGYLEFNKVFKNIHGTSIFRPHEMQWSILDYRRKILETHDEEERRCEEIIEERA